MTAEAAPARELAPEGRLRVALNMANVLLAQSRAAVETPAGVTIDLARALASELGLEPEWQPWPTPGEALRALAEGRADIGFLAVDPERAREVHFTAPYVQIEGGYLAHVDAPARHQDEVDRPETEVLVIETSAYDLYLTRALRHAKVVRFPRAGDVTEALLRRHSGVCYAAGIKPALQADVARHPGLRVLDGRFMAILQAMVLPAARGPAVRTFVERFLATQRANGFVAAALARHGIDGATVVEPASP